MKIFANWLSLIIQIPIIINKHGTDAFEINENEIEKLIVEKLIKKPMLSAVGLFLIIHKIKRMVERYFGKKAF